MHILLKSLKKGHLTIEEEGASGFPSSFFERMYYVDGKNKFLIRNMKALKNLVNIRNHDSAVEFVRLRTFISTFYLFDGNFKEIDVINKDIITKNNVFGYNELFNKIKNGQIIGYIDKKNIKTGYNIYPVIEKRGKYFITRLLLNSENSISVLTECVDEDGNYDVIKRKKIPQKQAISLHLDFPKYSLK